MATIRALTISSMEVVDTDKGHLPNSTRGDLHHPNIMSLLHRGSMMDMVPHLTSKIDHLKDTRHPIDLHQIRAIIEMIDSIHHSNLLLVNHLHLANSHLLNIISPQFKMLVLLNSNSHLLLNNHNLVLMWMLMVLMMDQGK